MSHALKNLPESLVREAGMPGVGVWIGREDNSRDDQCRQCTVGEWLSRKENQSGEWYIDGGWGGPPGAD